MRKIAKFFFTAAAFVTAFAVSFNLLGALHQGYGAKPLDSMTSYILSCAVFISFTFTLLQLPACIRVGRAYLAARKS